MNLLPYLNLTNPNNGSCIELVNNCATLATTGARPQWTNANVDCEECCPECIDQGYTGNTDEDGQWWYEAGQPGADDVVGFLVHEMDLESPTSARRLGETSNETPEYSPRQLTIRGTLLADSRQGLYYLQNAITQALSNPCGPCDGYEAEILPFCPSADALEPSIPPEIWLPTDLEASFAPCEGIDCPEAEPLEAAGEVPTQVDNGIRTILRVRFQYFDVDPESEASPTCWGADVIIGFEVFEDKEWGEEISGLCAERPLVGDDCWPHDFSKCLWLPELSACDFGEDAVAEEEDSFEGIRPLVGRTIRYCQPLYTTRRSCLTPVLPVGAEVAPILRLSTGTEELTNLRILFHPAYTGVPAPETCQGWEFYSNHATCAKIMIAGPVPDNARIEIDGRRQRSFIWCGSEEPVAAEELIEGWDWPTLDPTCRYWVTSVADCFNTSEDARLALSYSPRFG